MSSNVEPDWASFGDFGSLLLALRELRGFSSDKELALRASRIKPFHRFSDGHTISNWRRGEPLGKSKRSREMVAQLRKALAIPDNPADPLTNAWDLLLASAYKGSGAAEQGEKERARTRGSHGGREEVGLPLDPERPHEPDEKPEAEAPAGEGGRPSLIAGRSRRGRTLPIADAIQRRMSVHEMLENIVSMGAGSNRFRYVAMSSIVCLLACIVIFPLYNSAHVEAAASDVDRSVRCTVVDPEPPLNIRQYPNSANIIGGLDKGEKVAIIGNDPDYKSRTWYKISTKSGMKGYVFWKYIKC